MWGSCTLLSFISLKSAFYILYIHTFNRAGKENDQYVIVLIINYWYKNNNNAPPQKKNSSDDNPGTMPDFGAGASLPLF